MKSRKKDLPSTHNVSEMSSSSSSTFLTNHVQLNVTLTVVFIIAELIVLGVASSPASIVDMALQWQWLLLFGLLFGATTKWASSPAQFFTGGPTLRENLENTKSKATVFLILSMSTFISWVFAKSVYNVSTLGAEFGWVGCLGKNISLQPLMLKLLLTKYCQ